MTLLRRQSINIWFPRDWVRAGNKGLGPRARGVLPSRALGLALASGFLAAAIFNPHRAAQANSEAEPNRRPVDERAALMESALFTRVEFFGAQALVPYPTAEARNRLAAVRDKSPNESPVYLKLSQLDEKLGREEEALKEMQGFVEHEPDEMKALETMAAFWHRRAQFTAEAGVLERMLRIAPPERRVEIFQELIELAQTQLLKKYLAPAFYEQTLAQKPSAFEIIEQYIQKLIDERNHPEALRVLRQYRDHFPDRRALLIEKEAAIFEAMGREKEAEAAYTRAFDPFWPVELSEKFYQFLKDHDRFRAYGHELRVAFRHDPTDFHTAVKLLHYSQHASEGSPDVFVQLEKARAARKIVWKQDELVTIARLLIADGYADAASRFLYTLYLQGEMKAGSTLRAQVLYQLFELLSDAGNQRLSLTHGDLTFYQDIASADTHPGMLGGILSLILSDTNPKKEFEIETERAVVHFNRAAAYRIFTAYKQEYPTAPELAQMYLDIVRLYTATKETAVAADTLNEFEQRYADAPQYPEVALKLADCYIAAGKYEEERALYQRVLDYLGQHRQKDAALVPSSKQPRITSGYNQQSQALDIDSEPTDIKPSLISYPPASNPGIEVPDETRATTNRDYASDNYSHTKYADYLAGTERVSHGGKRQSSSSVDQLSGVDYATVLARYVGSLAKDDRTADILVLYANEIKKYGEEQGLYEQLLQWLGQTNMVEEQLRVYQETLKKFPTTMWRDRLARWFLRRQRTQEFEALSRDLLARLNNEGAEQYLHKFIDSGAYANASGFDANLCHGLYALAHQRFPHNLNFVTGLLKFYSAHNEWQQWRQLTSEYYFESREIRDQFLSHLASRGELRGYFNRAREVCHQQAQRDFAAPSILPYKLFRADAAVWLSNYEEAIDAYRELNRLYPNTPEFSERLINFTRSLGQHNRKFLEESAAASHAMADAIPSSAEYRTRAGEIQAELGDYNRARGEWEQLIALGRGRPETYLDAATVYWDYFQYDDALRTIKALRRQTNDEAVYAFQAGAILEAQHQWRASLSEYIKALDDDTSDYQRVAEVARAKRRLVTLSRRPGVWEQIVLAFNDELGRRGNGSGLLLNYVDFLIDAKRWQTASALLSEEVARSDSQYFLQRARDIFADNKETRGQAAALRRLVDVARSPHFAISYRLQLAEVYEQAGQRKLAAAVLRGLVHRFPTNYGVLSETADFYWRMGLRADSLGVLRTGMQRGIGKFHYVFGRKLAAREMELNRVADAGRVLKKLHDEDRLNSQVFHELARLYVRTGNKEALRQSFRATLEAIKQQDLDIKQIRAQVAELREQMIEASTRLKDYAAALEQHIEIINRDAEDQEKVEAAINYVKRYGGGDTLLNYYRRTSAQAYKNYRWNVVLARIYEAKGDLANAARQYRLGLDNQPEMLELYDALADIYTRTRDYDSAIAALNKTAELSNDDPQYIKRLIEVLEKAGRHREAEIARQKLPHEEPKKLSVGDQFAEAARLRGNERKRAIATYREAFNAFSAAPFKHDLKAPEIAGYVRTLRDEEPLDQITRRLWELRSRMISESERVNSQQAGKARTLLEVLDGAVPEAVGGIAAERATGDELSLLFSFLKEQIESAVRSGGDRTGTFAFLQNLSRRAGFGSLEEQILLEQKDIAYSSGEPSSYHSRLRALVDFYDERGAYSHIIELLGTERLRDPAREQFEYLQFIAANCRLLGDRGRELEALRENYRQSNAHPLLLSSSAEPLVERYFDALYENGEAGRNELLACAREPTSHQLQLVNFLLRNGEKQLAHAAIENAPLPVAWKLSRHAEASLALREFDARNEGYFLSALQFHPIGELITQRPDTDKQLVADDWFRLVQTYGRWLYSSAGQEQRLKSRFLLPAMTENRPQDVAEQARLGRWYLERKDTARALEHLRLAHESQPDDKKISADLGAAFLLLGDRGKAEELWQQIISGDPSLEDCESYLNTLTKHGLAAEARKRLTPLLTKRFEESFKDEAEYDSTGWKERFEKMKALVRALAASFADQDISTLSSNERVSRMSPAGEAARAAFFRKLCAAAPNNLFLPGFLVRESLVARTEAGPFYRLLIERSSGLSSYERDYAYTALQRKAFDNSGIEEALDHESEYKPSEPDSKRIKWQKEYLEYLIERNQAAEAHRLITSIESEIKRRYARPVWLRLAALRLEIRNGRIAQACDGLAHLAGVETSGNLTAIKPPSIERLNEATALLRSEGRDVEARALIEAAYARQIALEQYEPAYLVGLASIAFKRGDAVLGLKWLQSMVNLSKDELKAETAAELAALPLVKAHSVKARGAELPSPDYGIEQAMALRLAGEIAGEFAQFDRAIAYRQELSSVSPDDKENRIELVRLLAANRRTDEAINNLTMIISDRTTARNLRWQAVWLAPEITEQRPELWTSLRERVRTLNSTESEMAVALEALSLSSAGRTDEGIKLVVAAGSADPNPYLISFRAILEMKQGHDRDSLNSFTRALVAGRDLPAWQSLAFLEDEPLEQLIRLYLKQNQPRAAVKLAERVAALRPEARADESGEGRQTGVEIAGPRLELERYQTLRARTEVRKRTARAELLELLSEAAERMGDLDRASEMEKARLAILASSADRRTAHLRIDRLHELQRKAERQPRPSLVIDQKLVAVASG